MGLELKNIMKKYNKPVLNNINLHLTEGVYGLLGPNGAGKSTLIRTICDIEAPSSGEVLYDGTAVSELGEQYRDILGYVPQKVGYYPDFTARDFLVYMATVKGLEKSSHKKRIDEVLDLVSLKDTGRKKIKNFSGGMKQRLGIAQAILNHPRILILDEPTVGLDLEERLHFKQFISEYASERIVIFATHIVSDIEDIGNEILILQNGTIRKQASQEELLLQIAGKVWDCKCDKDTAYTLKQKYKVSNTKVKNGAVNMRILAEEKPVAQAVPAEGNLQDLYLYLFGKKE